MKLSFTRANKIIIVLLIIIPIIIILLIIYYLPTPLIETIDTEQDLLMTIVKTHQTENNKIMTKSKQYRIMHSTNTYDNFINYISKYSYRKMYDTFFYNRSSEISYIICDYDLMLIPAEYESNKYFSVHDDGKIWISKYGFSAFTYKLIFNKDEDMNKFVENIIEIIKGDEVESLN